MISYSQRVERKDGMAVYYFTFFDQDKTVVQRIINSNIKERLGALSVAVAKDTNLRIKMPYWTDDNDFLFECRMFFNQQKSGVNMAEMEVADYLRSIFKC